MHACPLCGSADATCGGPSTAVPIDAVAEIDETEHTMADEHEMVMVQVQPGDVRKVARGDLDRFMDVHTGATVMDEGAESKAIDGPPATKARRRSRSK